MLKAKRAADFIETGTYLVETGDGIKKIYRDPETRWWVEDASPPPGQAATHQFWTECVLSTENRPEALAKLEALYGTPARKGVTVERAADVGADSEHKWLTICNTHNTMIGSDSKKLAKAAAENTEWCEECQESGQ